MFSVIFPGQGSQIVGMGKNFFEKYSLVKDLFKEADNALGFSLSKIILDGPKEKLDLTVNTQPAIFLISYSIFNVIKKEFNLDLNKAKYFAGHSLGEYSALSCAGYLGFQETLRILRIRGDAMQNAVPKGEGGMIAVLGSEIGSIDYKFSVDHNLGELNYNEISSGLNFGTTLDDRYELIALGAKDEINNGLDGETDNYWLLVKDTLNNEVRIHGFYSDGAYLGDATWGLGEPVDSLDLGIVETLFRIDYINHPGLRDGTAGYGEPITINELKSFNDLGFSTFNNTPNNTELIQHSESGLLEIHHKEKGQYHQIHLLDKNGINFGLS